MSLDVSLTLPTSIKRKSSGIFIRENGATIEISIKEWNEKYPDNAVKEENYPEQEYETNEVYSANITHNLNKMAAAAGIYNELWRPEEVGIKIAWQLVEPLSKGYATLMAIPEYFKNFNDKNGWGTYEQFLKFIENYMIACLKYPGAEVSVSR